MFTVRLCFSVRGVCQCRRVGVSGRVFKTVSGCSVRHREAVTVTEWNALKPSAFNLMSVLVERIRSTCGLQRSPLYYDRGQTCEALGGCGVQGCHSVRLTSSISG